MGQRIETRTRQCAVGAVVLAMLGTLPPPAGATSCDKGDSIAGETRRATAIVVASVVNVTPPPARVTHGSDGSTTVQGTGGPSQIELIVEETFKGATTRRLAFSSDYPFKGGERYLIYLSGEADRPVAAACSRIRIASDAAVDLQYQQGQRNGRRQGVVHGQVARQGADGERYGPLDQLVVVAAGATRHEIKTGRYGRFEMVMPPGRYLMWVEKDGRQLANPDTLDVAEGDQPKHFEVVDSTPHQLDHLIGATAIGPIAIGMTLADAQLAAPSATFRRTSDGDGAALVEVVFGADRLVLSAGEDDADAPIDWARKIQVIETFDPEFATSDGVRVGTPVGAVEATWGAVTEIVLSEIESRQYIRFDRQPRTFTVRIDHGGDFSSGGRRTNKYHAGARIQSIAIGRPPSF